MVRQRSPTPSSEVQIFLPLLKILKIVVHCILSSFVYLYFAQVVTVVVILLQPTPVFKTEQMFVSNLIPFYFIKYLLKLK